MGTTEDFDGGDDSVFSQEVDPEYEFDAAHFCDFVKDETESEARDAENWFLFAHEYPPSPFLVKYKLMKAAKSIHMKPPKTSSKKKEANKIASTSNNSDCDNDHKAASNEGKDKGVKNHSHNPQNKMKAKSKSAKPFVSAGEKLWSPIRSQNQTTKRQKLEFGYLHKKHIMRQPGKQIDLNNVP
ncbi:hypothetical protein M8C21_029978, partial [Ambrosia artemisiifolia]